MTAGGYAEVYYATIEGTGDLKQNGGSKPPPYGVWGVCVIPIEGIGDLKHLPHIMGT